MAAEARTPIVSLLLLLLPRLRRLGSGIVVVVGSRFLEAYLELKGG